MNNLRRKIKDETNTLNLSVYADLGTHWIALYGNDIEIICYKSFGVENISK